ncbi:12380_t:CDS:1 [Funneliformis mosseae]|uniref:12380_t:CDS:1 n=1 Tax=Funneliformis mosseae TaxID=27381 RepID=A0A9N9EKJ2_FUNMO|nr:12380_t:CDS:1 [Funneliformis mosseae]
MAFGKDNSVDGVYYIDPRNRRKTGAPSQLSKSSLLNFAIDISGTTYRSNSPTHPDGEDTLFRLVGNETIKENRSKAWYTPPNKPPPAYYRIHTGQADKKIYDIEYWLFYPYNGPTNFGLTPHEGDWEQATVRVYVDENAKDDKPKSQVLGVWMSAHSEGRWWAPSIYQSSGSDIGPLDFEEGRPIVYSAINSHANYGTIGTQKYLAKKIIYLEDHTDKGQKWPIADNLIKILEDTDRQFDVEKTKVINNQFWVKFRGKWGRYVDYVVDIGSGPITPIEAGNIIDPAQWKSQKFPFDPIPK